MEGSGQGYWHVKRLNSETGPCPGGGGGGYWSTWSNNFVPTGASKENCGKGCGTDLSDAMRADYSVSGQTEVLWKISSGTGRKKRSVNDNDKYIDDPKWNLTVSICLYSSNYCIKLDHGCVKGLFQNV